MAKRRNPTQRALHARSDQPVSVPATSEMEGRRLGSTGVTRLLLAGVVPTRL